MASFDLFGVVLSPWIVIPSVYAGIIILGLAIKRILIVWLRHLTSRTETKIDDILIEAANWPVSVMIFVWGLTLTLHAFGSRVPDTWTHYALIGSKAMTLAAAVLFADRLLIGGFRAGTEKFDVLRSSEAFGGVLIHGLVFVIGGLMMLDSMGISITPIIASLGLGSLAVALALQPTLENAFSGFQILIDQPIKPGNFIRLESGEEGFVHQIRWRTTWIRQGLNNMIIIPNKQLVNARVLNYDYPTSDLLFTVPMGVHYSSDLQKVERVVVEVGQQVLKAVPGAVPDWTPVVRYNKFDASSINFVVVLRAKTFGDSGTVTHEFMKAVKARFDAEKIVMPYPIVALDTDQQQARVRPA